MAKDLRKYIDKLKKATPDEQKKVILSVLKKNQKIMVGMIQSQLLHGIDGDGKSLQPYRNKEYAAFKKTLNPLGVTDLKLTGGFHRSIFADVSSLLVMFGASDPKATALIKKYGDNILKLNEESKGILVKKYFEPQVIAWYKRLYRF